MAKIQGVVIGLSSLAMGLLSIPIFYISLIQWDTVPCLKIPYLPGRFLGSPVSIIILCGAIAAVAVAGFVGGLWRIRGLAGFYLLAMLVPIALLGLLVGFVFLATRDVAGQDQPSLAPSAYRLPEFPGWLRGRVESIEKWESLRSCLAATNLCAELEQMYRIPQDFFAAQITPLQAGCCKPPTECGYSYGGPTYWTLPNNTAAGMDCLLWSNNQTRLCYPCDSCKAGLLADLAGEWKHKDYFLFAVFCVAVILHIVAFCAFLRKDTASYGDDKYYNSSGNNRYFLAVSKTLVCSMPSIFLCVTP